MHRRYILDASAERAYDNVSIGTVADRVGGSSSTSPRPCSRRAAGAAGVRLGPFHFDFGDGPPRGGRGRRGRTRMFGSGELRLVLLKLIADEPRHGYDLIRAMEELTAGEYAPSPGVVYPTLTLLQDMGLIEEAKEKGPRKPFQVTDEGRKHLEEKADEVETLFERLEEEFAPPRAQLRRADDRAGGRQSDECAQPSHRPRWDR